MGLRLIGSASAMLLAVPLHAAFDVRSDREARAWRWGSAEAWAQRTSTLALALACFLQPWLVAPPLMLVLPVLWCALRGGRRETAAQAFCIGALAYATTMLGVGPAAAAAEVGLSPVQMVMLPYAYGLLAGAVAVPALLAVLVMHAASSRERHASRTLQRLMAATEDLAIVLTDTRGVVQQANDRAGHMYGSSPEALVGAPVPWFAGEDILEIVDPRTVDVQRILPAWLARTAGSLLTDCHLRLPDGSTRWFDIRVVEVRDDDALLGYLITAADVTERAEIEHALRRALERETDSLRLLQDTDRFKDELVSTVSHELRTPITSILGYVEMLGEEIEDSAPGLGRLLEPVNRNAHRLHRLVDDLLLLDSLEHGDREPHRRPVDLRQLVCEAVDRADGRAARGVRVVEGPSIQRGTEPTVIDADATRMSRVIDALIDNAVKFSPAGGSVCVDLSPLQASDLEPAGTPGFVEVAVQDQGPGIADHDLARVFDRFYRSSSAYADQVQGSGLGLSVCKAVIEDHGGTIALRPGPHGGTEASCLLPMSALVGADAPRAPLPRPLVASQREAPALERSDEAGTAVA